MKLIFPRLLIWSRRLRIDSTHVKVVSPGNLSENSIEVDNREIKDLEDEGKTVVYVLEDEKAVWAIALADIVREESDSIFLVWEVERGFWNYWLCFKLL